ncbi:hypothetical protein GobsT_33790 [Gemmata obscuriglobus]|uniref:TIGR02996 domain-containing protein n=1 Tax=Gemmata obscuriglobus TaxID=114 RepID=A0A2Z3HB79_9BACT|nr:TIGR02996 domain-containing protein [Gemmata obscuriglobus]AWM38470.1 TIGR02996 domain-containing protein [Gemmata obscuriglobus]QEG28596.1 hypothetical protein GobsT_33790 [Gemmata obscuriglobus]VTS06746.1 Repeat-companion domain protein OS=Isosphaera pallida (strain ATCC 43644 / DSM 9630 / IS1B) GN=Isop_0537 PE=4 SV=1 [Gemmata obscuriglobus UQM 2246]
MNDHDALLRAIGEQPEEDTPRLMYADWLEEQDQPERADFVRNQVALNRPGLSGEERTPLVRKNRFYLDNWVPSWKAELPRIPGIEWGDFRRGLIEEVLADGPASVVDRAAEIFAVPGIHILRLRWLVPHRARSRVQDLARRPELERLRALRLVAGRADASALRALVNSPHLGRLSVLDLHGNYADDDTAAALADGRFPALAELWLGSNPVVSSWAIYE